MKPNSLIIVIAAMLIVAASCKSKSQKDAEDYMKEIEKTMKENSPKTDEQTNAASPIPQGMENIVGEWEMVGSIVDTNDNLQIDEDERKNLQPTSIKDYMKLNSDGTGLFTVAKMEGRYEVKAKESGEKEYLTWYDRANAPHRIGTIIKVTEDELHIKEPGGSGLFIWIRL